MAIKLNSILGILSAVVVATVLFRVSSVHGIRKESVVWLPIKNLTDPMVVEIGKFAVSEYNKQSKYIKKLSYEKIVKGEESKIVDGKNYRLEIEAKNSTGSSHNYLAEVCDKPGKKYRNLTSFKELEPSFYSMKF